MEHRLATDQIREQAALYALGAMSQIEARAFENHLADGCKICRSEVAGFDGVVGVLGLGAPPASPPGQLRDLLMARIAKEPRNVSRREIRGTGAGQSAASRVYSPSRWAVALPWAVAACLGIFAVASTIRLQGVVIRLQGVVRSTDEDVNRLRADLQNVNFLLTQARTRDEEHVRTISMLERPGSAHVFLAQKDAPAESSADVFFNTQERRLLVAAQMPRAPAGTVYQLWYLKGAAAPRSAGLIPTDESGHGFPEVSIPADAIGFTAAAITLEPAGGSAQPTMPIYVYGAPKAGT